MCVCVCDISPVRFPGFRYWSRRRRNRYSEDGVEIGIRPFSEECDWDSMRRPVGIPRNVFQCACNQLPLGGNRKDAASARQRTLVLPPTWAHVSARLIRPPPPQGEGGGGEGGGIGVGGGLTLSG